MKISRTNRKFQCDVVMCKNYAENILDFGTFFGKLHLCNSCISKVKNLFLSRTKDNDESKK